MDDVILEKFQEGRGSYLELELNGLNQITPLRLNDRLDSPNGKKGGFQILDEFV